MTRMCSQCGNNGHNSRTCSDATAAGSGGGASPAASAATGGNCIMLFGVRLTEGSSFRKSASMNNLAQFDDQPHDSNPDLAAGYDSDDVVHASAQNRERKRGVPWTEEEHKLFLLGLQKVGKGDWRGISRNFVKTRTPTQVASHAQKYFLRRSNHNRRRRRSSLFDITTDTFVGSAMEEDQFQVEIASQPHLNNNLNGFPVSNFPVLPVAGETSSGTEGPKVIRPIPAFPIPPSSKMADLNLNHTPTADPLPLSLKLSVSQSPPSPSSEQKSPPARHPSGFQGMSGSFNSSSGDSIISVA